MIKALLVSCVDHIRRCELGAVYRLMECGIPKRLGEVSHGIVGGCAFKLDGTGDDQSATAVTRRFRRRIVVT